jgi:hypothetical protein
MSNAARWMIFVVLFIVGMIGNASVRASPVQFDFLSTCCGTGSSFPGTAPGQPFTISIIADNGNSSLASQTWATGDFISATASIDAVYNALYSASGALFSATTDISGQVASINLFDAVGSDNLGASNATIFVNGAHNILFSSGHLADANDLTTPDQWRVSAANAVPTPSTLPLFGTGLGLVGLFGWWRRRRGLHRQVRCNS